MRFGSGKNLKPGKRLENAQSPTRRVHALLAALTERRPSGSKITTKPILKYFTYNKVFRNHQKRFEPTLNLTKQSHRQNKKQSLWTALDATCQPGYYRKLTLPTRMTCSMKILKDSQYAVARQRRLRAKRHDRTTKDASAAQKQ